MGVAAAAVAAKNGIKSEEGRGEVEKRKEGKRGEQRELEWGGRGQAGLDLDRPARKEGTLPGHAGLENRVPQKWLTLGCVI